MWRTGITAGMAAWLWAGHAAIALAGPESPFARRGETPQPRRYERWEADPPARVGGRSAAGAIEAWTFRDGVVEHARFEDPRTRLLMESRSFNDRGEPLVTARFREGRPWDAVIHGIGDHTVSIADWIPQRLDGAVVLGPPGAVVADGLTAWPTPKGTFYAQVSGPADVTSDLFRDGLATTCGCALVDRSTAYIDGKPGVHYLARIPDGTTALVAEIWAVPFQGGTLYANFVAPQAGPEFPGPDLAESLAYGRAMVHLIQWEKQR